jgi:exodeoxyribonuclease V beta subunit
MSERCQMTIRATKPAALATVDLTRPAVIEASAGTGKTYTLEHLVVALLLEAELRLPEILVVTFTEKATAELAARIRATLLRLLAIAEGRRPSDDSGQASFVLDDKARRALKTALAEIDRAQISTIHGFCQRVLSETAFAAGRVLDERPVDGGSLHNSAFAALLREELTVDPEARRWLEAWQSQRPLGELERLLREAHATRARLGRPLDFAAACALFAAVDADQLVDRGADGALLAGVLHTFRVDGLPAALAALPSAKELAPLFDVPGVDALAGDLPSFEDAVASVLLPRLQRRLAADKRAAGVYDFDDMLTLVDGALTGPAGDGLAAALRTRYRAALIDEFQDTDEVQWRIFRRLFPPEQPGSRLFLVGDPKQSIYSFRGADVATYLSARATVVEAGGTLLQLDECFRTTPALLDRVHDILARGFFRGAVRYDAPVRPGRPELALSTASGTPAPSLMLIEIDGSPPAAELRARLGQAMAREIAQLAADRLVIDGRTIGLDDIFVLTQTRNEGLEVARHLAAANLPYSFFRQEGLFGTDEATELLDVLLALERPDDRRRRRRALVSRFFAVPLAALAGADDIPVGHPLAARWEAWLALATAGEMGALLVRIGEDSGLARRALFGADPVDARIAANVDKLLEILTAEAAIGRPGVGQLARRLASFIQGRAQPTAFGRDADVQPLVDGSDRGVQILTLHKSKGLEADVVFLFGGFFNAPGFGPRLYHDNGERRMTLATPHRSVADAVDAERAGERERVLYVGMTRARARLYLPFVPEAKRLNGAYRQINEALIGLAGDPAWAERVPRRKAVSRALPPPAPRPPAPRALGGLKLPAPPPTPPALAGRAGFEITSYSRMKQETEERETHDRFAEVVVAPPGPDELPAGAGSGVFLHAILETAPPAGAGESLADWLARPAVDRAIARQARRFSVAGPQRAHAERMVHAAWTTPPPGLAPLGSARTGLNELQFLLPRSDGDMVRGFIDLVADIDGRVVLVDWKSDLLGNWDAETLSGVVGTHYRLQARLYTLALVRHLKIVDETAWQRFGGIVYCFLRGLPPVSGGGWYVERPSWSEVMTWHEELLGGSR